MIQDRRVIHIGARTEVIAQDIILMQAEINYTLLTLTSGPQIVVAYHLGKLQERLLDHQTFIRPNRNTIINLNFVTNYDEECISINDRKIQISRRRKETISLNIENFNKTKAQYLKFEKNKVN
ncbi:LytTr DNA-binding domain-containing protein [Spirosomataceae bacterium TFI 002]|nr:LytTr DNA-binding domain-containing protein [Spirosomataceae bacterium TFI 002]